MSLCNLPLAVLAGRAVVDRDVEHEIAGQRTDVVGNKFWAVFVPSRQTHKAAQGVVRELFLDIGVWEQRQSLRVHSVHGFARIQLGALTQYIVLRRHVAQQALDVVARCFPSFQAAFVGPDIPRIVSMQ